MPLPTAKFRALLEWIAVYYDLPSWDGWPAAVWLEGLVLHESRGDPRAQYAPEHSIPDSRSYGLFQVLGQTARRLLSGEDGSFQYDRLFDPLTNAGVGCQVLRFFLKTSGGDVARALAKYNGGMRGDELDPKTGEIRRADYIRLVRQGCERVTGDRR